tara:strand:- start:2996 stop:3748 length:753 start_codon:yes stop_codon:yes gene_type:complete
MEGFKFYMINRDINIKRRNNMESLYDNNDLIRIRAYDGDLLESYDDIIVNPNILKDINKYEYGCSLSHLRAIHTAYIDGNEEAFIIEDDIFNTYKNDWKYNLRDLISKAPADAECILFFCINPDCSRRLIVNEKLFIKKPSNCYSTGCYYIRRNGMKKIIDQYIDDNNIINMTLKTNFTPQDRKKFIADNGLIYPILNTFVCTEPTFIDECKSSTIHTIHLKRHKVNNNIIKNYFLKIKNNKGQNIKNKK